MHDNIHCTPKGNMSEISIFMLLQRIEFIQMAPQYPWYGITSSCPSRIEFGASHLDSSFSRSHVVWGKEPIPSWYATCWLKGNSKNEDEIMRMMPHCIQDKLIFCTKYQLRHGSSPPQGSTHLSMIFSSFMQHGQTSPWPNPCVLQGTCHISVRSVRLPWCSCLFECLQNECLKRS